METGDYICLTTAFISFCTGFGINLRNPFIYIENKNARLAVMTAILMGSIAGIVFAPDKLMPWVGLGAGFVEGALFENYSRTK